MGASASSNYNLQNHAENDHFVYVLVTTYSQWHCIYCTSPEDAKYTIHSIEIV